MGPSGTCDTFTTLRAPQKKANAAGMGLIARVNFFSRGARPEPDALHHVPLVKGLPSNASVFRGEADFEGPL